MKSKKLFSLILSITMLATCILPVTAANAQENTDISQVASPSATMMDSKATSDYVIDAACKAFPEYTDKIQTDHITLPNAAKIQTMGTNHIVVQEQREISDTEMVAYTEYSNGISLASILYTTGKTITNTSTVGTSTTYTFNAWLKIIGSHDTMIINDIKLQIAPSYSQFKNKGNVSAASSAILPVLGDSKTTGNLGSKSAFIEYWGGFRIQVGIPGGEINHVQNAKLKVSASNNMQIELTSGII